ncbi:MAG TPA: glycine cleavage system aminomethyltransferase GcvT [Lacipirellulaceae bacterium]|nr:glycine cleavage system aminomethyltransferase GcvT [Lacipirellulaceae bacterium]
MTELLRTPLYDWHIAHGGRMVDFAGWSMPVQYTSIAEEHNATRNAVGVFDISHMGRLQFYVPVPFLDSIVTRRVDDMKATRIRYSLICNEQGGILDDVLIYAGIPQPNAFSMVVNSSNHQKVVDWVKRHEVAWHERHRESTFSFGDVISRGTAMLAVQGPKAIDVIASSVSITDDRLPNDVRRLRYYTCCIAYFGEDQVWLSRTGYTGEDGFELICDAEASERIWTQCIEKATGLGGMAAGLGARDTLRLEAAMPLYGHELSETINPYQAGLGFAVNLEGREFVGREALVRFAADKSQPMRVGLQVDGKRVPRQGCPVLQGDEVVGEVTSGTFSPTFGRPIAMAYVRPSAHAVGTKLAVDIRGTHCAVVVVPLPFYERGKKT